MQILWIVWFNMRIGAPTYMEKHWSSSVANSVIEDLCTLEPKTCGYHLTMKSSNQKVNPKDIYKNYASSLSCSTPPKTNIVPEKWWLEDYLPFEMVLLGGYLFLSIPSHLQVTNGSASVASGLKPKRSIMLDQCERPGSWIQKKRCPRRKKNGFP